MKKPSGKQLYLIFKRAIDTFGTTKQLAVAIEEMAELTKLLCKKIEGRFGDNSYNQVSVIDEVADVVVMIEQVKLIFGITDRDINERVAFKATRLKEALDKLQVKAKKAGVKI